MKVTIRNDYHGTEARVRVPGLPADLSRRQRNRVRRALCGITGCQCGGELSERGPQGVDITVCNAAGDVRLYSRA